jgi:hypothetical protein
MNKMPKYKLNDDELINFIIDIFEEKITPTILIKKYGVGGSTFKRSIERAISLELITKEQNNERLKEISSMTIRQRTIFIHGKEKADLFLINAFNKGIGHKKYASKIIEWSSLGGKTAHILHPELKNKILGGPSNYYLKKDCSYGNIEFHSYEERYFAFLLAEYGLLKSDDPEKPIVSGENFQRKIGTKKVDFYIIREPKNLIIEYHPPLKGTPLNLAYTWKAKRKQYLESYLKEKPFELLVIREISEILLPKKANILGISKDWETYLKNRGSVNQRIKAYDENRIIFPWQEIKDEESPF